MIREENGQIIVSKLRPMSEKSELYKEILIKVIGEDRLKTGYRDDRDYCIENFYLKIEECEGWVPFPQYTPEQL